MRLAPVGISEKDAVLCFGMSKMTQVDESRDINAKYKRLLYVEMLEFLGRVAACKFQGTEMDALPLYQKIEYILDDIFPLVGEKRKEAKHTEADEISESDDEY